MKDNIDRDKNILDKIYTNEVRILKCTDQPAVNYFLLCYFIHINFLCMESVIYTLKQMVDYK